MMKRGTRGMGHVYQRGSTWWIAYYHHGKKVRESSGSSKKKPAVDLLKRRHEEMGKGRPFREAKNVLLTDLRALVDGDYKVNARRSEKRLGQSWAHLADAFGEREPAISITAPRLASLRHRQDGSRSRAGDGEDRAGRAQGGVQSRPQGRCPPRERVPLWLAEDLALQAESPLL
jgi:hypothetical protein